MRLRRFLMFSLLAVVLGASVAGGGYWAYWNFYARWRPVTIVKNQADIQKLLDAAGAVSPGRTGPWLYMITYRACAPCARYQREEFPKLAEANVDTRVIAYARPDREGQTQSTAAERATVAELWINRDWNLYLKWMAAPRQTWRRRTCAPPTATLRAPPWSTPRASSPTRSSPSSRPTAWARNIRC